MYTHVHVHVHVHVYVHVHVHVHCTLTKLQSHPLISVIQYGVHSKKKKTLHA